MVAVPHKTLGEEPGAVVHLKQGASATEQELRAFVAERIAAFKVPVKIVFWPENPPAQRQRQDPESRTEEGFRRTRVRIG